MNSGTEKRHLFKTINELEQMKMGNALRRMKGEYYYCTNNGLITSKDNNIGKSQRHRRDVSILRRGILKGRCARVCLSVLQNKYDMARTGLRGKERYSKN